MRVMREDYHTCIISFLFGDAERLDVVRDHNTFCFSWMCLISKSGQASSCSESLTYDHSGITNTFLWHEESPVDFPVT